MVGGFWRPCGPEAKDLAWMIVLGEANRPGLGGGSQRGDPLWLCKGREGKLFPDFGRDSRSALEVHRAE